MTRTKRCSSLSSQKEGQLTPTVIVRNLLLLLVVVLTTLPFQNQSSSCEARQSPFQSRQWWGRIRGGHDDDVMDSQKENDPTEGSSYFSYPHQPSVTSSETLTTNATTANNNQTITIPEWKRNLPEPLRSKKPRTFQRICVPYQNQVAEIYLLGTAHVSNDSSWDVKLLLQTLHPDVIFVELCDQRTTLMEDPPEALQSTLNNQTTPFWQKVNEIQFQTNNSKFQCMATVLLTQTQEEYADSLGVELGGEFRAAYQYWRSFRTPTTTTNMQQQSPAIPTTTASSKKQPHLILGDRPLAITLARCWESLSWFGKIKVVIGLLISSFHKPNPEELREWIQKILQDDETDLLKASLEDLRKHFPTLERVIIQERDAYMACKLYQLCRGMLVQAARSSASSSSSTTAATSYYDQQQQQQHSHGSSSRIVIAALVGAGHVPGICEWLTNRSHPQTPEEMLENLIATKKFQNEDLSQLVFDVTELQDLPPEQ